MIIEFKAKIHEYVFNALSKHYVYYLANIEFNQNTQYADCQSFIFLRNPPIHVGNL